MDLVRKYEAGLVYGERAMTTELLLNRKKSDNTKLYFEAYDANLFPLPEFKHWPEKGKRKLIAQINKKVTENVTVLVDGTVVKERI